MMSFGVRISGRKPHKRCQNRHWLSKTKLPEPFDVPAVGLEIKIRVMPQMEEHNRQTKPANSSFVALQM
jgi:hypothetical protein